MKLKRIKANEVRPDDWAYHVSGRLDSRRVARVDHATGEVWLIIVTEEPIGPFDLHNYSYIRKAGS